MTWTPEERAYVDAVASVVTLLTTDSSAQHHAWQKLHAARAALDAAQASQAAPVCIGASALPKTTTTQPAATVDSPFTWEMASVGCANLRLPATSENLRLIEKAYRAMRAAEPT